MRCYAFTNQLFNSFTQLSTVVISGPTHTHAFSLNKLFWLCCFLFRFFPTATSQPVGITESRCIFWPKLCVTWFLYALCRSLHSQPLCILWQVHEVQCYGHTGTQSWCLLINTGLWGIASSVKETVWENGPKIFSRNLTTIFSNWSLYLALIVTFMDLSAVWYSARVHQVIAFWSQQPLDWDGEGGGGGGGCRASVLEMFRMRNVIKPLPAFFKRVV